MAELGWATATPRTCRHPRALRLLSVDAAGAPVSTCGRCHVTVDPTRMRRGRTSSSRGRRIQHDRIVALGGRNLAGNNPNLDGLGEMFRYESKSGEAFPERPWRWLKGIPVQAGQIGVLIITEKPGRGRKARSVVVVDFDDWRDLHGETKEGTA